VPSTIENCTSDQGNYNTPHDPHATTDLENGEGSNDFDGTQLPEREREMDGLKNWFFL